MRLPDPYCSSICARHPPVLLTWRWVAWGFVLLKYPARERVLFYHTNLCITLESTWAVIHNAPSYSLLSPHCSPTDAWVWVGEGHQGQPGSESLPKTPRSILDPDGGNSCWRNSFKGIWNQDEVGSWPSMAHREKGH